MAVPLGERGLTVAGVDRSWAMLGYARGKGLSRLMHGDAYHLPIRSASVAHVLYVHVLHLLSHPAAALREAHRVSRGEVVALFHRQRPIRTHPSASVRAPVREAFYRRLAHEGYPLDPRPSRPWRRERELLSRFPPTRLTTLSEGVRVETATERLRLVRRRALRKFIDVPAEVIEAAVDEILPQVDGWRTTFEDTVLCAQWRPAKGGTRHRAPRGGGN
jgi:SAM-dependent methyltransferase